MNHPFVRWLLDLDIIPQGAEGLRLGWERAVPAWVWASSLLVAAALAGWGYARLQGARRGRVILAAVRFLVVVAVLVIVSGPVLELPRESIEQDWVVMLVDRSASMTIPDGGESLLGADRMSRDQQLRDLLESHGDLWKRLAAKRHILWMGFHDGAFTLSAPPGEFATPSEISALPVALDEPTGSQTRLDAALDQALQRTAAREVAGVVVFSDGRTTDPPSRSSIRRLRSGQIGVFAVPLGSAESPGDLAIRRIDVPRHAFVRDQVPVAVEIDRLAAGSAAGHAVVKLIDEATGAVLDRAEVDAVEGTAEVTLTAEPTLAGEATWRVVVESDGPDLVADNNVKTALIELIDRPLRVLYIDGYPRWEYRYLKNLLVREETIESSVMLISADRDFAQEGNQPITRLPRSPEEFAPFDVIVIGDVPGSFFSPEQLEMIRGHVAQRGAGLLWIGGERFTPRTYAGTALADLLPLRGSLAVPAIGEPGTMVPTPLAERMGLLRLGVDGAWPSELGDPTRGWSQFYWAQRLEPGRLKPTAEVLAETGSKFRGSALPLVVQMRYGSGLTMYVATDEIWRWRFGRGEVLTERFWVPIVRRLGRESLFGSQETARLEAEPRRLTTGQALRVELSLLDASLVDDTRVSVAAVIETVGGQRVADLELRRQEDPAREMSGQPARFATTWLPAAANQLIVKVSDPAVPSVALSVPVEVFAPDDELRRPETDHPLLEALAAETGGQVIMPNELEGLPELLPNRAVTTVNPLHERIWDTPLAFLVVLVLLTVEWIGRKVIRLA